MTETVEAAAPPRPRGNVRWVICGLLFLAVVLSYIDRLVIGVLKPTLTELYDWTEGGYANTALVFQALASKRARGPSGLPPTRAYMYQ